MSTPPPPPGYGTLPPPPGGHGPPPPMPYPQGGPPRGGGSTRTLGIIALVAGIIALPASCCWLLGWIPALTAIACGGVGLTQLRHEPGSDAKPYLVSGLVLGLLALALVALWFFLGIASSLVDNQYY